MTSGAGERAADSPRPPSRVRYVAVGVLGPLALILLALWFGIQIRQLDTMRSMVRASYDKRFTATDLIRGLDEAESAQRGYVITGDTAFLGAYDASHKKSLDSLGDLRGLYVSSPDQIARLDRLGGLIDAKFAEMAHVIGVRRSAGGGAAGALVTNRQGVVLMREVRGLVAALGNAEQSTLADRLGSVRSYFQAMRTFVWISMLVAGIALLVALWFVWRAQTARYRVEQEAHAAAARQRAIFASTIDALLILDESGRIRMANAAAGRMLGYAPEELIDRDGSTILGVSEGDGDFHARMGLRDGALAQPNRLDRTVRHRDGHTIPIDIALGLMELPGEVHIVASLRDISERKAMERLKDEFVSTVSHELRTPLTSVVGSLGLLRSGSVGELPDAARRLVEIAENNSRRLIRLINDILDIEKIGSGRMHFDSVPLDVARMLDQAIDGSRGLASTKQVRLELEAAERPLIVQGDADRLLQVVTNLLSNAVRFSPEGGTVRASLTRDGDNAVVAIEDEGPGVPADFRDRIFERFSQAGDGAAMSGGTGLGLAISREIVLAHQGRIWFGEAPGGGARFTFSLPLPPPDPRTESGARPRILVCEANVQAAEIVRGILEREGCLVDCVATAREAQQAARTGRYDGFILDVALPDENGLEVVRALRRRADTRLLPIIVVSGIVDPQSAGAAALEVIDWIDKPVDQERLIRAVRRAVEHSATTRPTLLHIDDDLDMLEVTATALAEQGRMLRATTVASARELLGQQTPDIVILDVALPDGSGLELLPDLLLADGTAIPTIIYSATDVLPEVRGQVDAVLVKSRRSLPNLAQTIRRLLASVSTTDAR
ncbi:ATP-binding protein [Sphingomonas oryzagri]|uniref:histidine kinase n=1 Tax=Sphingomonas oryzagri TaxID=3042314 RepID=A0ABT6N394_9SPHN|nr:ATP-binding protein [Sphingomonas oryzagri]MDH7639774.1 CHASE3 domain-containing protein [Sphingomonas oryzagri]